MASLSDWEKVTPDKPLGSGGQSTVYLVRKPDRKAARQKSFEVLRFLSGQGFNDKTALEFSRAALDVAREDYPAELGALKIFHPRGEGPDAEQQAFERMRNEIEVLRKNYLGLVAYLDSSESERWIVTQYCPGGTLDHHLSRFRGNAKLALRTFLSLVSTVAELHKKSIVHRDIKPQNIFVNEDGNLLLGDFGIVFLPNEPDRVTVTGESVGPRDFMPPWVLLDDKPAIKPTFDVYMLGKVLWCMVTGRMRLHREDFRDPRFNVTTLYPGDPDMYAVNQILEKTVVTREKDCLQSAGDLLLMVNTFAEMTKYNGQIRRDEVPKPCRFCGIGQYQPVQHSVGQPDLAISVGLNRQVNNVDQHVSSLRLTPLVCDKCGHTQVFRL